MIAKIRRWSLFTKMEVAKLFKPVQNMLAIMDDTTLTRPKETR